MFCSNCGKEASGNFCSSCGSKIDNTDQYDLKENTIVNGMMDSDKDEKQKKSYWDKLKEQANDINKKNQEIAQKKKDEKQELKGRIKQMDKDRVAYCPKCYSTDLTAHKKGFGVGKAVVGAAAASVVFAPIGLVAGNIGAKKVRVTCLKCGHQFWAGQK
ncbi:MAG TPA: hypothetical protein DHU59_13545 [Clostridiales bacterium]|nr:hypothetical protein [Clostridiales bacterium]